MEGIGGMTIGFICWKPRLPFLALCHQFAWSVHEYGWLLETPPVHRPHGASGDRRRIRNRSAHRQVSLVAYFVRSRHSHFPVFPEPYLIFFICLSPYLVISVMAEMLPRKYRVTRRTA